MVHGRLGIAEENSGILVSCIRGEAKRIAETQGQELIITDVPPGIGCPVIAAIGGATALALVVEPTVSGLTLRVAGRRETMQEALHRYLPLEAGKKAG